MLFFNVLNMEVLHRVKKFKNDLLIYSLKKEKNDA